MADDVLDGSFRRNVARPCSKKRLESPPNLRREFQRDQLQQTQGNRREHDKPFTTLPAALDLLHVRFRRLLEMLIFLRFAGVARQSFRPEAVAKRANEMFEHGKQGLHPYSEAIQLNRRHWRHLQITRHQDDGTATGQRKDKADEAAGRFPQEIESQVRHVFEGAIDLAGCALKEMQVVEDLVEFDFVAVGSRPAWAGMARALITLVEAPSFSRKFCMAMQLMTVASMPMWSPATLSMPSALMERPRTILPPPITIPI